MEKTETTRTVVLGLGNMLMADDGVGLAALARLRDAYCLPHDVELVDGGTWGMNLLHVVEGADHLLIFDAISLGGKPGSLVRLEGNAIPRFLLQKVSPHQVDLREVLALAELRGLLPRRLVALGIEPARVEMSTELTPVVEANLDEVVRMGVATLEQWGIHCRPWTAHSMAADGNLQLMQA
jgi:hydrogenase maturation protease